MALVSALTWEKRMAGGVIMLQTWMEIIRLDRKPEPEDELLLLCNPLQWELTGAHRDCVCPTREKGLQTPLTH